MAQLCAHKGVPNHPDEQIASLLRLGVQGVLLKGGEHGAFLGRPGMDVAHVPAFPVEVTDTTAAGDTFNGAFATGLMVGKTEQQSLTFAVAAASLSVTRRGAQPSMPTSSEVEAMLQRHSVRDERRGYPLDL
jgi:ribokinase